MIDTSSIESFIVTLPDDKESKIAKSILELKFGNCESVKKATMSLAEKGFIGCCVFGTLQGTKIGLRLLPDKKINESPIVVFWKGMHEGFSFASELKHFIAGSMALIDITQQDGINSTIFSKSILNLTSQFGDNKSVENILSVIGETNNIKKHEMSAFLFDKAEPNDILFSSLGIILRMREVEEEENWILTNLKKYPDNEIVLRLFISLQPWTETILNTTEAFWNLILKDDVFDTSYNARLPGYGVIENRPLKKYIVKLSENGINEIPISRDFWEAAVRNAKDHKKYDGMLHLEFAKKIANQNPLLSYTQTCNAAAYYARSKKKPPVEAINFAYELAKENKWQHLETLLRWTVEGMDK